MELANWCKGETEGVVIDHEGDSWRYCGTQLQVSYRSSPTEWETWDQSGGVFAPLAAQAIAHYWPSSAPVVDSSSGGRKDDQGKVRVDLLPFDALTAVADVMTWRCTKSESVPNPYPERNWEKGMSWHRLFRAALSHLWAWWLQTDEGKGPGNDKESGRSHLVHAACCVLFLVAYELRTVGTDDRPLRNK